MKDRSDKNVWFGFNMVSGKCNPLKGRILNAQSVKKIEKNNFSFHYKLLELYKVINLSF